MSENSQAHQIAFDYIKSNFFRVAHVDGVIGSCTPGGFLHFAAYSERSAIPRQIVHEVSPDGKLGAEIPAMTDTRGSIVREIEVDLVMSFQVAASLRDWIDVQLQSVQNVVDNDRSEGK